jgi:hypothetical protein
LGFFEILTRPAAAVGCERIERKVPTLDDIDVARNDSRVLAAARARHLARAFVGAFN